VNIIASSGPVRFTAARDSIACCPNPPPPRDDSTDQGGGKRRDDNISSIGDRQDRHLIVQYEECIWDKGYQMQDDLKEQHPTEAAKCIVS
jgi:hypothetical protein